MQDPGYPLVSNFSGPTPSRAYDVLDWMAYPPDSEFQRAHQEREEEKARRKAEHEAAARKMTDAEKQRARIDALIVWAEEALRTLSESGQLSPAELIFPDPHPTAGAPESEPRRTRNDRNAAAALAFLENDK